MGTVKRGLIIDLLGKRFGRLVVIKETDKRSHRNVVWQCRCDCGTICEIVGTSLRSGRTQSCGCLQRERTKEVNIKPNDWAAKYKLLDGYRRNAKERGLPFELTEEEFFTLIKQSCYYCNNEPNNVMRLNYYNKQEPERCYIYNGIDRIDNSKGYIKGNVVTCCKTCNWAKRDMSLEQFKNWIKRIYINLYKKVTDKTPGELVDQLVTTNLLCFYEQEKIKSSTENSEDALIAAKRTQKLNARRNKLIRSIDFVLDFEEDTPTAKTYKED